MTEVFGKCLSVDDEKMKLEVENYLLPDIANIVYEYLIGDEDHMKILVELSEIFESIMGKDDEEIW